MLEGDTERMAKTAITLLMIFSIITAISANRLVTFDDLYNYPQLEAISMSPDGTRVILRENRSKVQYWMMEGIESLISGEAH